MNIFLVLVLIWKYISPCSFHGDDIDQAAAVRFILTAEDALRICELGVAEHKSLLRDLDHVAVTSERKVRDSFLNAIRSWPRKGSIMLEWDTEKNSNNSRVK
jgi:hypothetical protein